MIKLQATSLRHIVDSLKCSAEFILNIQLDNGAIPWFKDGKLDPWDHTEAAMALSVMGYWQSAERAYQWLADNQLPDGSWNAHYFCDEKNPLRETNFIAYIATGVWHHFLISNDTKFLNALFPVLEKAINFVLKQQSEHGDIAWAVNSKGKAQNDALLTACSSVLRSLECAYLCAQALGIDKPDWSQKGHRLAQALTLKPYRFDRTWESKNRFAMDWYYPILAGLYDTTTSQLRIQQRWSEFVVQDLGCKCVSDEPWVTMAETSELIMALCHAGELSKAKGLYKTLAQWRDKSGGYWTGYVYRDKTLWPEEQTTWTAAAVVLAADALYKISPASELFLTRSLFLTHATL